MISKKNIIQKGFRIDTRIVKNLDILANITGRSQNELATLAFQNLFSENAMYFIEDGVIDALHNSSSFTIEVAGLGICYEEKILLFYSKNKQQEIDQFCNCLATMNSYEVNEILDVQISRMKNKGYILFNALQVHLKEEDFLQELHKVLSEEVDINFTEMQEWINKEFNYL